MDFLELCQTRYSVREFDRDRPVPRQALQTILEAARWAPTGRNAQPWKVFVLEGADALRRAETCSTCLYGAPTVLLFCYDSAHPESNLDINHVDVGLTDAVLAAAHAMLAAVDQGVGSCWVCWFEEDKVREAFDLRDPWKPACFLPLGYPKMGPGPRHGVRKPLEELVRHL